jgi:hypothetical protein
MILTERLNYFGGFRGSGEARFLGDWKNWVSGNSAMLQLNLVPASHSSTIL